MSKQNKFDKDEMDELSDYHSSRSEKDSMAILSILDKNFKPNKKQQEFIKTIIESDIIITHGSSGSGKTITTLYCALQEAIKQYNKKLVLIRPVFESASQSLGSLPGDLDDKLAPHVRAFKYTLEELLGGPKLVRDLIEKDKIRFEVLNYLRGATLNNSIIICDEAQNMTLEEMMLALTRLGKNSKIIFTGDFYQTDLRKAKGSIIKFADLIKDIKGVSKFTFTSADVVRNSILVEVTRVWEEYKSKQ
jgi:phosphate starvation-inducible PhoH-like protein